MSDEQMKPRFVDAASDDPFDLAKLRLPQDFLAESPVKRLLTTVPVRRPGPQDFVRVHPSAAYRHLMALLKIEDDRDEIYAVDLNAVPDLRNECYAANLFTAITEPAWCFSGPCGSLLRTAASMSGTSLRPQQQKQRCGIGFE